jgi:hypothetical protein
MIDVGTDREGENPLNPPKGGDGKGRAGEWSKDKYTESVLTGYRLSTVWWVNDVGG